CAGPSFSGTWSAMVSTLAWCGAATSRANRRSKAYSTASHPAACPTPTGSWSRDSSCRPTTASETTTSTTSGRPSRSSSSDHYPNTIPPFFPTGAVVARPPTPEDYELRRAGIQAHNRWLADWCAGHPERRAGIGQVILYKVEDAVADARWCHEHGLRGGILIH